VPIPLQEAARSFFAADYDRALRLLDALPEGDARVAAARQLFGAAASHALYARSGERDPRWLEAAKLHPPPESAPQEPE
jgi:hypothetical protein